MDRILLTGELDAVTADELGVPSTEVWNLSIRWLEEDGTLVKAGQKVLDFDNSSLLGGLEAKRLAAVQCGQELTAQAAKNLLDLADKGFAVAKQQIVLAKAELEAGAPPESFPRRIYQEKQLALERAKVDLARARDALATTEKAAELELELRRIALTNAQREVRVAEDAIASLSITAPRDGILVVADHPWEGRKLQVGDNVWPGMSVARLPDLAVMEVKAALSDVDDGRVAAGMAATCFLDAYPAAPLPGRVIKVSPVAREPERESLRRSFQVVVALERTDPTRMRPGMSVKVEIQALAQRGALIVPRAALDLAAHPARVRRADGRTQVVELGACNAEACVVTGGLDEGTRLASWTGS